MSWKDVQIGRAVRISRLCGEYVVEDVGRTPTGYYRIKVFERHDGYIAYPNIRFRLPEGVVEGTCGYGVTEIEALQDAIYAVQELLAPKEEWSEDDLDWADPRDF